MFMNNKLFGGKSVAILPFYPSLMGIGNMSHRGIEHEDMYQVSPFFLTMLCGMAFKGLITKYMGLEGPRMPITQLIPKWAQE